MDFLADILKTMTNQQLKIDPMVFLDLINKINGSDLASGTRKVRLHSENRYPDVNAHVTIHVVHFMERACIWNGLSYMGLVGQLYMLQCYKHGKGIILQQD